MKTSFLKTVVLSFSCLFLYSATSAQSVYAFACSGVAGYSGDGGSAATAQCFAPTGMAVNSRGQVFFADNGNNVVRMIDEHGLISTFAGNDTAGFSGDGGPALTAKLNGPIALAVDAADNIYICDAGNSAIRKVNSSGVITTVAGTGVAGFSGNFGPATAAKLNKPQGIAVDAEGNLYISDTYNQFIRKVTDSNGHIFNIAGTGSAGTSRSNTNALIANISYPGGITVDYIGNIYFSDQGNNMVKKINLSGDMTYFAGNGTYGYSGDGGVGTDASINVPQHLVTDAVGDLYFTEFGNHVVRKETRSGTIGTLAGTGARGNSGNGGDARSATFNGLLGIAYSSSGRIYISDEVENTIRVIAGAEAVNNINDNQKLVDVSPNPTDGYLNIRLNAAIDLIGYSVSSINGNVVIDFIREPSSHFSIDLNNLPNGIYLLNCSTSQGSVIKRFLLNK